MRSRIPTAAFRILCLWLSSFLLFSVHFAQAQDSPVFKDGIFLNFSDIKKNQPIAFSRVVSVITENPKEIFDQKEVEYVNDFGVKTKVKTTDIWGYADKGALFVQINNEFHRVTMTGTISHLFVNEKVVQSSHYDPYYYGYGSPMYSPTYESNRLVQYLIDFNTGAVYPMQLSTVEMLISPDNALFTEFMKLKKRKRKQMMLMYIRRFNENNPLILSTEK